MYSPRRGLWTPMAVQEMRSARLDWKAALLFCSMGAKCERTIDSVRHAGGNLRVIVTLETKKSRE